MAVDMFLKLAGIKGESTSHKHRDEIDVLSFSFGMSQVRAANGSGAAAGKAQIQDFRFVHNVDTASPDFFDHTCSGKLIEDGVFTVARTGGLKEGGDYYKITFENILISSVSPASNGDTPQEQVSLNFASFKVEARRQRPDGSLGAWETTSCDLVNQDKT